MGSMAVQTCFWSQIGIKPFSNSQAHGFSSAACMQFAQNGADVEFRGVARRSRGGRQSLYCPGPAHQAKDLGFARRSNLQSGHHAEIVRAGNGLFLKQAANRSGMEKYQAASAACSAICISSAVASREMTA